MGEGLTKGDGVDLALHRQGGVAALVGVHHLLQLRLADHQTRHARLVLLKRARDQGNTQR